MPTQLETIDEALKGTQDQYIEFLAKRDLIEKILRLRDEKNVMILGHNYMEPLVYQISGKNERGDSLALSQMAARSDRPIILFDGVLFMAETAKILSPDKKVLIADRTAGCSLADPFRGEDVRRFKRFYPGSPVVTYINSYAEVKAESDYCCTSANAVQVVLHAACEYNTQRVIFFPDSLMGANIQHEIRDQGIEVIYPGKHDESYGRCEVHEKFTRAQLLAIREQYDIPRGGEDAAILVHWECPPEVLQEADFYGSTSQMAKYIQTHPNLKRVYLATECEMAANLASEFPLVEFVKSCSVYCQHMRKITLEKILYSLENEVFEVHVREDVAQRARQAIDRMLAIH